MPRPPIQHHKVVHTIALSPELEEKIDSVLDRVTIHRAIQAGGEAVKGAVSHPAGYIGVVGAIIIALHTIPGISDVIINLEKQAAEATGRTVEEVVKGGWRSVTEGSAARNENERAMYERWINDLWNTIRGLFIGGAAAPPPQP